MDSIIIPQIDVNHFLSSGVWSLVFLFAAYLSFEIFFTPVINEYEKKDKILKLEKKTLAELMDHNKKILIDLEQTKKELQKKQQEYEDYNSHYANRKFLNYKEEMSKQLEKNIKKELLSYKNGEKKPVFFSYLTT
jgi:hypothetical protein